MSGTRSALYTGMSTWILKKAVSTAIGISAMLFLLQGAPLGAQSSEMSLGEIEALLDNIMESLSTREVHRLAIHIMNLSKKFNFPAATILSVISTESQFHANAVSPVGAIGMMQIMPVTADYIADRFDISVYRGVNDLFDPLVNVTLGVAYLSWLRDRYVVSTKYFSAYNMGPAKFNRMVKNKSPNLASVSAYVKKVHNGVYEIKREAQELTLE